MNDDGRYVGADHPNAKLNWHDVELIRRLHDEGLATTQIARKFDLPYSTIRDVVHYLTWPPNVTTTPNEPPPEHSSLAIQHTGQLYWNGVALDCAALREELTKVARQTPQPELQLRADKNTEYQLLAEVLADVANAGATRVGFVFDPEDAGAEGHGAATSHE